jgi:hypothetical protein
MDIADLAQALDIGENYLLGGLPGSVADARSLTSLSIDLQYASEGGMQVAARVTGVLCFAHDT